MKVFPLEKCCKTDYHLRFLESVELPQRVFYPPFSSLGLPKKQDMLLFVNDCNTRYTTKDGTQINTKDGDVVYVPKGCEYKVECIKNNEKSTSMQINFLLFDQDFSPFVLSEQIIVFSSLSISLRTLFEKSMLLANNTTNISLQKSILFEILNTLAQSTSSFIENSIIEPGFQYMHSHYAENPSIPHLASMCNVSNEYFRKLFKKQTGQSPAQYKNSLRIKRAEQYLLYTNVSIEEISFRLSFATVSHFIKIFKDAHGVSPLSFRNDFRKS